jgi:lipid-A-disaccharide synthase
MGSTHLSGITDSSKSNMSESRSPTSDRRSPLFVLVAGEASGDLLGADLIAGLRRLHPDARFAGIGGPLMKAAGMEIWRPLETLSVMGLVEVLRHLPALLSLRRDVFRRTLQARPAAFIGIDAPDFNLGLARRLKHAGIRTIHYVSPSVWAWREKRAATIGRSADRVLCLFPIEPPISARHGVDARFVGHPLAVRFPLHPDRTAARSELGIATDVPVLALLPGSRLGEIRRLGRDFIEAATRLRREIPDLQIVVPMANAASCTEFEQMLRESEAGPANDGTNGMRIVGPEDASAATVQSRAPTLSPAQTAMIAADAVLLASGTAALEAMLAKRPMVVAYRVAPLTYRLVRALRLLRTSVYSLPNILAGRTLVPELMQDACTPDALAAALAPALRNRHADPQLIAEFERLHETLLPPRADAAAAAVADVALR